MIQDNMDTMNVEWDTEVWTAALVDSRMAPALLRWVHGDHKDTTSPISVSEGMCWRLAPTSIFIVFWNVMMASCTESCLLMRHSIYRKLHILKKT